MITFAMFLGSAAAAWLGTKMGPSQDNDWANTSGMPAFALAGMLFIWAGIRVIS